MYYLTYTEAISLNSCNKYKINKKYNINQISFHILELCICNFQETFKLPTKKSSIL